MKIYMVSLLHRATINNTHANIYGVVIMTKAIARVHPVHMMNAN